MGWFTEGCGHEGYIACVFAYGMYGSGGKHTQISLLNPATSDRSPGKEPELVYGSAEGFLHEQLLPTHVRSVTGKSANLCIEWYFHRRPVSRVAALWRSWEHLRRLDPATGMSVWWKGPHRPPHACPPRPTRTVLQLRHERTQGARASGTENGSRWLVP